MNIKRTAITRCRREAFTLVEVLATLALAAIVIPVAMEGISLATATSGEARRMMEAASLAEVKLAELRLDDTLQNGTLDGDFGDEWPEYRWAAETSDWDGSTVKEISVRVEWTSRGKERGFTLTTLVYQNAQL